MPGKIRKNINPADDTTGVPVVNLTAPLTSTVDLSEHDDYAVQVVYGAGALVTDEMELQASSDGVNFATIPASVQTMDPAGSVHVWNVSDSHFKYVKVVIGGASIGTTILFTGEGDWD